MGRKESNHPYLPGKMIWNGVCLHVHVKAQEKAIYFKTFLLRKGIHPLEEKANIVQIWPEGMSLWTYKQKHGLRLSTMEKHKSLRRTNK